MLRETGPGDADGGAPTCPHCGLAVGGSPVCPISGRPRAASLRPPALRPKAMALAAAAETLILSSGGIGWESSTRLFYVDEEAPDTNAFELSLPFGNR